MANELTGNVWQLDTVGDVVYNQVNISSFLITPSAGSWVILLQDKNGKTVLKTSGTAVEPFAVPCGAASVEGLKVVTLTNCVVTVYK